MDSMPRCSRSIPDYELKNLSLQIRRGVAAVKLVSASADPTSSTRPACNFGVLNQAISLGHFSLGQQREVARAPEGDRNRLVPGDSTNAFHGVTEAKTLNEPPNEEAPLKAGLLR
jgi:hypothetical protein